MVKDQSARLCSRSRARCLIGEGIYEGIRVNEGMNA